MPSISPPLFVVLTLPQKSYQEAIILKHMRHPNIVPFVGIAGAPPQLVSKWMPGGNLIEYIKKNPWADRLGLVCPLPPFRDIAGSSTLASYSGSRTPSTISTPTTLFTETSKGQVDFENVALTR